MTAHHKGSCLFVFLQNIVLRLKFGKERVDTPQMYWQNVLWTDETKKMELFGNNRQHAATSGIEKDTAYHHGTIIPTMMCGGGYITIQGALLHQGLASMESMRGR